MPADFRLHVYGHAWAQQLLQTAVLSNRTAHAYLISGPDQVGKMTLARALAQALTCETPQPGPGLGACGRCRSCRLAHEASHPDHRLIEPSGGQLKIDQIRDLIREASLSPVEGRFKVFMLRSFDRANLNAANALLKTLEEPTPTTRILLTSSQATSLLPTITSRCQPLHLRPLPVTEVEIALQEGWGAPAEWATLLAGLSGGRLGWAVHMIRQPELWQAHERRLATMQGLTGKGRVERLALAERLATESDLEAVLRDWLLWWRDVMLAQENCYDLVVNRDQLSAVQTLAAATQPGETRRFLQALMTTADLMRSNVNTRLALEVLLLKLPSVA